MWSFIVVSYGGPREVYCTNGPQCHSGAHPPSLSKSHEGAAFVPQCPLKANGGMDVFAAGTDHTAHSLPEQQQHVPVVLS